MSVIETDGLTKRFGSLTAVDRLSFEVREGEIFGLLGPNGAGKTTTIRMLACLVSPTEGSAKIGGHDIRTGAPEIRQMVGILTENPSLYERLTANENMDFFAEAYGLTDTHERQNRIQEMLEFFDLWQRRNDKVATFSKGMKQKLAIARALVHKPPILLLDEPTAGLDPESAKEIRDMVEGLSHHEKSTILLCTHRLEDAERLCDRVMIVNRGKQVVVGTVDDLRKRMGRQAVLQVELNELSPKILEVVKKLEQVREVIPGDSATRLRITADDLRSATPEVVRAIVHAGGMVLSVGVLHPSLEDAYLKLVKEDQA